MVKKLKIKESCYNTSRKGRRVKESRYSDVVPYENRKYWYFTTHGIGPGTIPKGVHILDVKEGQNKKGTWGDYICLDAILNTSELREFDLIELAPDNMNERLMSENLSTNDTKHNWFLCSDSYETVEVLPEDKCNSLVIGAVYDDYVREGIIDEDDETYWDENKFYEDFKSDIIEAKYGVTKKETGLKTPSDDYIIIKDSDYVGKLPYGYYVDEDGDLLNKKEKVVGHVQNEPNVGYTDTRDEEDNLKVYRVWYLPDDPRERETFKDVHAPSKEDAKRQVSAYGLVTYIK